MGVTIMVFTKVELIKRETHNYHSIKFYEELRKYQSAYYKLPLKKRKKGKTKK